MKLSNATEASLDRWLNRKTWSSEHVLDTQRFYDFVNQYSKDHDCIDNTRNLYETICSKKGINPDDNHDLNKIIDKNVLLADHILDFLKYTGR
jgi:hypothetical protein